MRMPIISIKGLSKAYGSPETQLLIVLRNINLQIRRGEFVAIMGPSGSGKSTLLNIIGALDSFDAGEYHVDGIKVSSLDSDALAQLRSERFGFVFQHFNLIAQLDALANVELPMLYGNKRKLTRREHASRQLCNVGLADRMTHLPAELSGGQQQRVAIARALVNDPDVIIADEPTGSLDSENGQEIMQLFGALHRRGKTIIMVTHEEDIAAHASRIVRMRDGKIVKKAVTA